MPNVLLVGAFGQDNPGDEALCAAFCRALSGADVTVASSQPTLTRLRHAVAAIPASPTAVAREARHTDLVVVGGGSVFKSLHASTGRRANALLRSTAALVSFARLRGIPVAMVGVGAGTLAGRQAASLSRWLVRHTDLLVLRDEESAAVLSGAGVPAPFRVGADPAWVLLDEPAAVRRPGSTVTVALSHLAGITPTRLAAALRPLGSRFQIRLQPWQSGAQRGDFELAVDLRNRLDGEAVVVDPPADLPAARNEFASDQLVIALRFHALVAAGAAGTPTLAIAHEPKLAGLARRLNQPAVPAHASAEVLTQAVEDALRHPAPPHAAVRAEMVRAQEGFALLKLLLSRGDMEEPSDVGGLQLSNGAGSW